MPHKYGLYEMQGLSRKLTNYFLLNFLNEIFGCPTLFCLWSLFCLWYVTLKSKFCTKIFLLSLLFCVGFLVKWIQLSLSCKNFPMSGKDTEFSIFVMRSLCLRWCGTFSFVMFTLMLSLLVDCSYYLYCCVLPLPLLCVYLLHGFSKQNPSTVTKI